MKSNLIPGIVALCAFALVCGSAGCGGGGDGEDFTDDGSPTEVFGSSACSAVGYEKVLKVANGELCSADSRGDTSSVVEVQITNLAGQRFICTGTVISPTAVLSAAHCFARGAALVEVIATIGGAKQRRVARNVVSHPDFQVSDDAVYLNDAAVIVIDGSLSVPPTPILVSREAQEGEEAAVAGFGQTSGDSPVGGVLRAGRAVIRDVSSEHISISFRPNESHPCRGDSGGAIFVQDGGVLFVAGVVSQSAPDIPEEVICTVGDETLYTNIFNSNVSSFVLTVAPDAAIG